MIYGKVMNPIKRFLTAFIFYPLLVLWFIPAEFYRAYRKAGRMSQIPLSFPERYGEAKKLFKQELRVAMAARSRKPIDYSYLDQQLVEVKKLAGREEKEVLEKEFGEGTRVEVERRQRE